MSEDRIPTYAYVQGDYAREALEMHVGVRMDRQGRMVYQNGGLGPSVVITDPPLEFGVVAQIEPTIRLPETAARALYDALGRYFNGHEDTRALRRDYDHERDRVDKLTDALVGIAAHTTRRGIPV